VVSRNAQLQVTGAELAGSLDEALNRLSEAPRVFVIGGEQLFQQAFAKADRLYITEIDIDINDGDTFFEVPDAASWKEIERTPGSEGDITFNFVTLQRK
jgi:dihydrofolate reductase